MPAKSHLPQCTFNNLTSSSSHYTPLSSPLFSDSLYLYFQKHTTLPSSEFQYFEEDNAEKLNGFFDKFVLRHLKFPGVRFLYKPSPSNHGVLVPGEVVAHAERAAYVLLSELRSFHPQIPVIPIALLDWEGNGQHGSVQPMLEGVTPMTADPVRSGMSREQLESMFIQHWVDVFMSDLDGFRDNWLLLAHTLDPVRIDHGWSFHDDLVDDEAFPVKHMFGWKSVVHRLLRLYQENPAFVQLAQSALEEVALLLQQAVTPSLLERMLEPFFAIYDGYQARPELQQQLIQRYLHRAAHFTEFIQGQYHFLVHPQ